MRKTTATIRFFDRVLPVRREGVIYSGWLPFFGWLELDQDTCTMLELPVRYRWKVLMVEWFNHGLTFAALPVEKNGEYV